MSRIQRHHRLGGINRLHIKYEETFYADLVIYFEAVTK